MRSGASNSLTLSRPLSIHRAANLCPTGDTSGSCADRSSTSVVPALLLTSGLLTILVAWAVPADPLGRAEKQSLIDQYNQRLRASVGSPARR